jgi:hypothetical protein
MEDTEEKKSVNFKRTIEVTQSEQREKGHWGQ